MRLFIVVTPEKQNAALVTMISEARIETHLFVYPEDIQFQLCYHFKKLKFEELPDPLKQDNIFPFSNDHRNHWYNINLQS